MWLLVIVTIVLLLAAIGHVQERNEKSLIEAQKKSKLLELEKVQLSQTEKLSIETKKRWPNRQIDNSKSLASRNEDVIISFLEKFSQDPDIFSAHTFHMKFGMSYHFGDYIQNCINEIAILEGQKENAPGSNFLHIWNTNADPEYKELHAVIEQRFTDSLYKIFCQAHVELVEQFVANTKRKLSLKDEYGDPRVDLVEKEKRIVAKKIIERDSRFSYLNQYLKKDKYNSLSRSIIYFYLERSLTERLTTNQNTKVSSLDFSAMSGIEFESYIMKLLDENGFENVRGTPTTGDQGADILASLRGQSLAIQAKCYTATVGNKAVQEAASALQYYGVDEAWVITNSTFTKSAKELAQKTKVRLIEGYDLSNFAGFLTQFPLTT